MLPNSIKEKVYKKLMMNKLKGKTPSNVKELCKELGFARGIFYYTFTNKYDYCPLAEAKIREWVSKN